MRYEYRLGSTMTAFSIAAIFLIAFLSIVVPPFNVCAEKLLTDKQLDELIGTNIHNYNLIRLDFTFTNTEHFI